MFPNFWPCRRCRTTTSRLIAARFETQRLSSGATTPRNAFIATVYRVRAGDPIFVLSGRRQFVAKSKPVLIRHCKIPNLRWLAHSSEILKRMNDPEVEVALPQGTAKNENSPVAASEPLSASPLCMLAHLCAFRGLSPRCSRGASPVPSGVFQWLPRGPCRLCAVCSSVA